MKVSLSCALILLAIGAAYAASEANKLTFSTGLAYESEYVDDGVNTAHHVTMATLDAEYTLGRGKLQAGVTSINGQANNYTEEKFYLGYELPVHEKWTANGGVGYTWYPNNNPDIDRTYEVYAGLAYAGLWVNPELTVTYDVAVEQLLVELEGEYSWSLSRWGWKNWSVEAEAKVGTLSAHDADSDQVDGKTRNSYSFG